MTTVEPGSVMWYAGWISHVIPNNALVKILERFEINDSQNFELCGSVLSATRNAKPRERIPVEQLRERRNIFISALTHFRMINELAFFPQRDGSLSYSHLPPDPDAVKPEVWPVGTISAATFEKLLDALIQYDENFIKYYEKEAADKRALGTRTNLARHRFWFALLVFWYHDLDRKIAVTKDPDTHEVRGPLVEFMEAMSEHYVPEKQRTRAAIAGFVSRNKKRAMSDPSFNAG